MIIITAVYIPPQANTDQALKELYGNISEQETAHPDVAFVVTGDFNKANFRTIAPKYFQSFSLHFVLIDKYYLLQFIFFLTTTRVALSLIQNSPCATNKNTILQTKVFSLYGIHFSDKNRTIHKLTLMNVLRIFKLTKKTAFSSTISVINL